MDAGILVGLLLATVVAAEQCDFPIQIPIIQTLEYNQNRTTPDGSLLRIVMRTEYVLKTPMIWLETKPEGRYFRSDTIDGVRLEKTKLNNGDQELTLYNDVEVGEVSVYLAFDIGCTELSMSFGPYGNVPTVTAFNLGRIIEFPQPEVVYKPDEWMDVTFKIESEKQLNVRPEAMSYRDETGLHSIQFGLGPEQPPFEVDVISTSAPRSPQSGSQEMSMRVRAPRDLYNVIAKINLPLRNTPGFNYLMVSYVASFYQDIKTEAKFNVRSCDYFAKAPAKENDEYVVLLGSVNPCFMINVDGNPRPEFVLAELDGHRVERIYRDMDNRIITPVFEQEYYWFQDLKAGDTKLLHLSMKQGSEFIVEKIRLGMYVALELSVPSSSIDATQPGTVELQCTVTGSFKRLGFYKGQYYVSMEDSEALQVLPASDETETRTYTYNLGLTEDLIKWMKEDSGIIFCAGEGTFQTQYGEYHFSLYEDPYSVSINSTNYLPPSYTLN